MAYKIEEIEGIGPATGEKLATIQVRSTEDLLKQCATPKGRQGAAEKSGLSEAQLLKWANMADLMRISGIGGEYAELLEASGVDTVKELRHRNAENLASAMKTINDEKKLTRVVPSAKVVSGWVEAAKGLDPVIAH